MGTRADFYVGAGKKAEWLGSIAMDGYEWEDRIKDGEHDDIINATTENEYREAVKAMIQHRNDGTTPDMGWPWPWEDSTTTDYAYCWENGKIEVYNWGKKEMSPGWPNFGKHKGSAPAGDARSGMMVIGIKRE